MNTTEYFKRTIQAYLRALKKSPFFMTKTENAYDL